MSHPAAIFQRALEAGIESLTKRSNWSSTPNVSTADPNPTPQKPERVTLKQQTALMAIPSTSQTRTLSKSRTIQKFYRLVLSI